MPRIIETETRYTSEPVCRTAEEMTEICCEKADMLPCCEEVQSEWDGYSEEEVLESLGIKLDEQGRDEDGRYVEIRFEPRERPCGELVTRYDLTKDNCCDKITVLKFDRQATPDVLPHNGEIWLYATGGQPPYRWSVTSHALFFDDGSRSFETLWPAVRLHAGETFCGVGVVKVEDGCSTAALELRSDLGVWVYLGAKCALPGVDVVAADGSDGPWEAGANTLISGKYKQVETHQPIVAQILESPPSCGGAATQDCFECVGMNFTCPIGEMIRSTHQLNTPLCLNYPVNRLTQPELCWDGPCGGSWGGQVQAVCGDNAVASYSGYLSTEFGSCGLGIISTYSWIYQVSIALYQWRCG